MIGVVVVTNILFPPAPEPETEATPDTVIETPADAAADSPAAVGDDRTIRRDTSAPADPAEDVPERDTAAAQQGETAIDGEGGAVGAPAEDAQEVVEPDTVLVESPLYRYGFSTRGGALVLAELLRYESFTHEGPVQLVPEDADALIRYRLRIGDRDLDLGPREFRVEPAEGRRLEAGDTSTLRLRHDDAASGLSVVLEYTFLADEYEVQVAGQVTGAGETPRLLLDIGPTLAVNEASPEEDLQSLAYVVRNRRDGIESVNLRDVESQRIEEGPLTWVAVRNKYFLAAALSSRGEAALPFGGVIARPAQGEHSADLTATLPVARDGTFSHRLYLGPQESNRLAVLAEDIQDVNPVGYRIFRPIISPLAHMATWALVQLQGLLQIGYGWVLILFGFIIRGLLWPLNAKAMRAQLKNMEVQPQLKAIQKKYKDNPEKLQKEMLRLYKEEGFNPLGGCLPMLVPFPVLITLFFVFQNTIEFRGVEFLWLPDLSRPDPFYALPILMGLSMFALQFISMRSSPQSNPQMKMMMYIMPVVMVVIFFNLASGLNLYYASSNIATIPQQLILMKERRQFHEEREEENGESGGGGAEKEDPGGGRGGSAA